MKKNQKISLKEGEAVPFVITKTTLKKPPSIKRNSYFIGPIVGLKRLAYGVGIKVLEVLEEAFFEKDIEIDDGGIIKQSHFAVFVSNGSDGPFLEVKEIPWKPAAGHHYEIVRVEDSKELEGTSKDRDPLIVSRSKEKIEETRIELLKRLEEGQRRPNDNLTEKTPNQHNPTGPTST